MFRKIAAASFVLLVASITDACRPDMVPGDSSPTQVVLRPSARRTFGGIVTAYDKSGHVARRIVLKSVDYDSLMQKIRSPIQRASFYSGDSTVNGLAESLVTDSTGAGFETTFQGTDSTRYASLAASDSTVTEDFYSSANAHLAEIAYTANELQNPYELACTQGYASCWQCFKWSLTVAAAYMTAAWVCGDDTQGEAARDLTSMACEYATTNYEWKLSAFNAICYPSH